VNVVVVDFVLVDVVVADVVMVFIVAIPEGKFMKLKEIMNI
jgi:hypothetical protein